MKPNNTSVPPWLMYKLLLWTIGKLEKLLNKLMPADMRVLKSASGHSITQILYTAQKLGIFDALRNSDKTLVELSSDLQLHSASLFRLLRGLRTIGFIDRSGDYYRLTTTGAKLASGGSLNNQCRIMGSYWLDALGRLPESIKTGDKSPDPRFDGDFFHFLEQNKEAGVLFDNSMMELTRSFVPAILAEYDFSGCGHIVDVGGGTGFLLYSILEQYPHVEGTLFDVPGVIEKSENKPTDKCRYISGNFFESVPATGDLYILKLILHDWNDGKCIQILKNCRKAMQPGNKLLLLEFTINEDFESQFVRIYLDLLMMVMLNGQERSAGDLNTLLDASGFRMTRLIPTRSTINIVEAVAS